MLFNSSDHPFDVSSDHDGAVLALFRQLVDHLVVVHLLGAKGAARQSGQGRHNVHDHRLPGGKKNHIDLWMICHQHGRRAVHLDKAVGLSCHEAVAAAVVRLHTDVHGLSTFVHLHAPVDRQ